MSSQTAQTHSPSHRIWRMTRLHTKRTWRRIPLWIRTTAAAFLVAICGVLIGVYAAGARTYDVGPLEVTLRLTPVASGETVVALPPLGTLTFDTHNGPLQLNAEVAKLDESRTQHLIENPEELEKESEQAADDATTAVRDLIIRTSIIAVAVTGVFALLIFRQHWRRTLLACGMAIVMIGGVLGYAWETRNPGSIREPQYTGVLASAPIVIGDAEDINEKFGEYRGSLIQIITNFTRVYANLVNLPNTYEPDPNTIRVLHISDLHLNPASFDVITPIVEQFHINTVVDTGDMTDWGTDLENQYASQIGDLQVPYVFVRGNHDTQQTAEAVAAQPNAVVLDDQVKTVEGVTFAGIADPRYTPDKSEGDASKDSRPVVRQGKKLAKTIGRHDARSPDNPVDVALLHDPAGAPELDGAAPLVLSGHTHQRKTTELSEETTLRVEGSTGARGLRGFYEEELSAYNLSVLYFSKEGELQAADEITLSGADQQSITLNRVTF